MLDVVVCVELRGLALYLCREKGGAPPYSWREAPWESTLHASMPPLEKD
jgi:hypothetical protein